MFHIDLKMNCVRTYSGLFCSTSYGPLVFTNANNMTCIFETLESYSWQCSIDNDQAWGYILNKHMCVIICQNVQNKTRKCWQKCEKFPKSWGSNLSNNHKNDLHVYCYIQEIQWFDVEYGIYFTSETGFLIFSRVQSTIPVLRVK